MIQSDPSSVVRSYICLKTRHSLEVGVVKLSAPNLVWLLSIVDQVGYGGDDSRGDDALRMADVFSSNS